MAISKGTQYITDPNTIPVDTLTGLQQNLQNALNERVVISDPTIEVTVGAGGDYSTVNSAVEGLDREYHYFLSSGNTASIRLLSGFIWSEQLIVNNVNLSYITINSDDAEVIINRSSLLVESGLLGIGDRFAALQGNDFAVLPNINCLFNMDSSGTATGRSGILLNNGSKIKVSPGAGVKGCPEEGIGAYYSSTAIVNDTVFTENLGAGISSWGCSLVSADRADVSGSYYGVRAARGGELSFVNGIADNVLRHGIRADECGKINCFGASIVNPASNGVYAWQGSIIQANSVTCTTAGDYAVRSVNGSTIICRGATLTGATKSGISALEGSVVTAGFSLGDVSACDTSNSGESNVIAENGSTIDVGGCIGDNAGLNALQAENGSVIDAQSFTGMNSTSDAIIATRTSRIECSFATMTGAGGRAATVLQASIVNCEASDFSGSSGSEGINCLDACSANIRNANFQQGASPASTDIVVSRGGIISAVGATGGLGQTANTITSNGIIFQ